MDNRGSPTRPFAHLSPCRDPTLLGFRHGLQPSFEESRTDPGHVRVARMLS